MRHLPPRRRAEIVFGHAGVGARALFSDGLQQLPVGGEFLELMVVLVAQPYDVLPVLLDNADRVRKGEQPSSPGRQEIAVGIEDQDRVLGVAVEAVNPVLRIDGNRAGPDIEPGRRSLPLLVNPVGIFAATDDRFHCSLLCIYCAVHCRLQPPTPLPASGEREGPAKREGEGQPPRYPCNSCFSLASRSRIGKTSSALAGGTGKFTRTTPRSR